MERTHHNAGKAALEKEGAKIIKIICDDQFDYNRAISLLSKASQSVAIDATLSGSESNGIVWELMQLQSATYIDKKEKENLCNGQSGSPSGGRCLYPVEQCPHYRGGKCS
jgi:hypothetical protein